MSRIVKSSLAGNLSNALELAIEVEFTSINLYSATSAKISARTGVIAAGKRSATSDSTNLRNSPSSSLSSVPLPTKQLWKEISPATFAFMVLELPDASAVVWSFADSDKSSGSAYVASCRYKLSKSSMHACQLCPKMSWTTYLSSSVVGMMAVSVEISSSTSARLNPLLFAKSSTSFESRSSPRRNPKTGKCANCH